MPEDYYSMGDEGTSADKGSAPAPEGDEHDEQMEGESALLPKSILAGKKFDVGDEVVLEIVAMHDDEVEVKYAKEKGDAEGEGESEMGKAEGRLSSMAGPAGGGNSGY